MFSLQPVVVVAVKDPIIKDFSSKFIKVYFISTKNELISSKCLQRDVLRGGAVVG